MTSVALIGPDGAGKTTIGQHVEPLIPVPIKYVYMGVNLDASNHMLLTTRLIRGIKRARGDAPDRGGPRDPSQVDRRPKNPLRRALREARSLVSLALRMSEEWYRQLIAWKYQRQGCIVIFDRHYFSDYYAYDIAHRGQDQPLSRRIHGLMLDRVYPKPGLTIYLDAPAEVLFARKGEGTIETLELRRQSYMQLGAQLEHFAVVDANRPLDDVAREVADLIYRFHLSRGGKPAAVSAAGR